MQEPYIYVSVFDDALHIGKKLPKEAAPRELFDVHVSDICSDGLDEASKKLGATILGILKLWHPESLAGLAGPIEPSGARSSGAAFETALFLIDRFSAGAPESRLKLVDEILAEAASDDTFAKEYWLNDWPPLRRRLLLPNTDG